MKLQGRYSHLGNIASVRVEDVGDELFASEEGWYVGQRQRISLPERDSRFLMNFLVRMVIGCSRSALVSISTGFVEARREGFKRVELAEAEGQNQ